MASRYPQHLQLFKGLQQDEKVSGKVSGMPNVFKRTAESLKIPHQNLPHTGRTRARPDGETTFQAGRPALGPAPRAGRGGRREPHRRRRGGHCTPHERGTAWRIGERSKWVKQLKCTKWVRPEAFLWSF